MNSQTTISVTYKYGGPVTVPVATFALMRDKSTHFLMLTYLALVRAAVTRTTTQLIEFVAAQIALSEWYVQRGIRILERLGLVRRDDEGVIEIIETLHPKTMNALLGIEAGTVTIDIKEEAIVHKKSGRTLDLSVVPSQPTKKPELSPVNDCLQTTVVPSQLGAKAISADDEQASLFTSDRRDEEKSCAGGLSDIDILSSNTSIGNNTSSIGNNTKLSDKPSRGGRPSFQWVEGEDPEMDEVWKFWRDTLYPNRKAPNSSDWSRIRCRLRDGASVDEMKQVVVHAKNDPWLNGTDPNNRRGKRYDSIEVLFNSHSKFEKYLADAETSKTAIQRDVRGIDLRARASTDGQTTHNVRL